MIRVIDILLPAHIIWIILGTVTLTKGSNSSFLLFQLGYALFALTILRTILLSCLGVVALSSCQDTRNNTTLDVPTKFIPEERMAAILSVIFMFIPEMVGMVLFPLETLQYTDTYMDHYLFYIWTGVTIWFYGAVGVVYGLMWLLRFSCKRVCVCCKSQEEMVADAIIGVVGKV